MDVAWQGYSAAQALRTGGREPVRGALLAARARTLALADSFEAGLSPAGMRVPFAAGVNPPLWELGHIGWFQEYWVGRNRQRQRGVACDPDHAREPSLLEQADCWYDSGRVEHRSRWELPLPGPAGTRAYLEGTLAQTLELLERLPAGAGHDALYFFRLAALHEQMHAEAAVYMARGLGLELPAMAALPHPHEPAQVLQVPAQVFRLGWAGEGFAFDNELRARSVALTAFGIDARPVSWERFEPFVREGGYGQAQWWSVAGWTWLQAGGRAAPRPAMEPHEPVVHLSAHEAQAWCRWAGRRLPTEAEWECAALTAPGFGWGRVWEWTASAFEPYPGFTPHPYRDYSQPWFGSRQVLRGACDATDPVLAHPRYRNFFEPHRTDIFAGFRSCA